MGETIKVEHITKVEGHASLTIKVDAGKIEKCELSATEGSRYFEGLLKGRKYNEAHEISSRICGICSVAHTLCALQAIERALGIMPTEQTIKLRELMMLGERIRSHATHLYFLSLPDYLGFESAIKMAAQNKKYIEAALKLMKTGNKIIHTIGSREIHPVSAAIGGFLKLPKQEQLEELKEELKTAKEEAIATAKLFAKLHYPEYARETEYFSLSKKGEYPILYGTLKSQTHIFKQRVYDVYLREYHEPYSTANFVVKRGKSYMVGALARLNNNREYLNKEAKKLLEESKIKFPNHNPFTNNFAQAIELVHCIEHALQICEMKIKDETIPEYFVKAGHGIAAIEVPRGVLWHDYRINESGEIINANIITPTTQNLRNMQDDIREYAQQILKLPKDKFVLEIEKLIRAYDPCFSCSTHFLEVKWE